MKKEKEPAMLTISRKLREAFDTAFMEEMVPGIIHNFANPLNGIMGRSSLIQRRTEDRLKKISADPETKESPKHHAGMIKDIEIVSREADRLSEMLRVVSETYVNITDASRQRVNLSQVLFLEMRFFEFHLDFKHNVKRTLRLEEIPDVTGSPADFVLSLSAMMRHAIRSTAGSPSREISLLTGCEDGCVKVEIGYRAGDPADEQVCISGQDEDSIDQDAAEDSLGAFLLTAKYGARIRIVKGGGWVKRLIEIPCRKP